MTRVLLLAAAIVLLAPPEPLQATEVVQSQSQTQPASGYCCLPMKWHSRLTKTNEKLFTFVRDGATEMESAKLIPLEVFVNYRRPKFELRSPGSGGDGGGSSVVFWRGHMWLFQADADWPRLLNPVPHGYRPSGGFAPLFFRCLADKNGFQRVNSSHYRMSEPDATPAGKRLGLATVTDVRVVPADGLAGQKSTRGPAPTCLLTGFSVTSRYAKFVPGKGLAIVTDVDDYRLPAPSRIGWPDQSLTQRTRAYRGHFRALLRSSRIQKNRPDLGVPVAAVEAATIAVAAKFSEIY